MVRLVHDGTGGWKALGVLHEDAEGQPVRRKVTKRKCRKRPCPKPAPRPEPGATPSPDLEELHHE